MTKIVIFTDPHLGKMLASHTTHDSRRRLQQAIFDQLGRVQDLYPCAVRVCGGDLFDKFQNPEQVLLQGYDALRRMAYCMAGNHDVVADVKRMGSLQALEEISGAGFGRIIRAPFNEVHTESVEHLESDTVLHFVPHHTTDELFEQALQKATTALQANKERLGKRRHYLLLHCNYASGFATNDVTLNLTRQRAQQLLEAGFDYIIIGHDHSPKEDFNGRVIVLGNLHPTSFGDITDKRILVINEDGSHEFKTVWTQETNYLCVDVQELLNPDPEIMARKMPGVQFLEIVGQVEAKQVFEVSKAVKKLWEHLPFAIAANFVLASGAETVVPGTEATFHDIADQIREELSPELLVLFNALWAETAPAVDDY